jgi:hypothetical protein
VNIYRLLARVVLLFHWLWIFVILGGSVFSIWYPQYAKFNLLAIIITVLVEIPSRGCPLVKIENILREKYSSEKIITGPFINFWIQEWTGIIIPKNIFNYIFAIVMGIFAATTLWSVYKASF